MNIKFEFENKFLEKCILLQRYFWHKFSLFKLFSFLHFFHYLGFFCENVIRTNWFSISLYYNPHLCQKYWFLKKHKNKMANTYLIKSCTYSLFGSQVYIIWIIINVGVAGMQSFVLLLLCHFLDCQEPVLSHLYSLGHVANAGIFWNGWIRHFM